MKSSLMKSWLNGGWQRFSSLDKSKQFLLVMCLLLGGYWLFFSGTKASCSMLESTKWRVSLDKQPDLKGYLVIDSVVPYKDYPTISRLIGSMDIEKNTRSFNMALCFMQDGKVYLQNINLPSGAGPSTYFSTESFDTGAQSIRIDLFHNAPGAPGSIDQKGYISLL